MTPPYGVILDFFVRESILTITTALSTLYLLAWDKAADPSVAPCLRGSLLPKAGAFHILAEVLAGDLDLLAHLVQAGAHAFGDAVA